MLIANFRVFKGCPGVCFEFLLTVPLSHCSLCSLWHGLAARHGTLWCRIHRQCFARERTRVCVSTANKLRSMTLVQRQRKGHSEPFSPVPVSLRCMISAISQTAVSVAASREYGKLRSTHTNIQSHTHIG